MEASKPLKILNELLRTSGVKKESMASFYSQFPEAWKQTDEDVREFNDRFNTLSSLRALFSNVTLTLLKELYNLPSRIDFLQT
jgi:hypothetical protein